MKILQQIGLIIDIVGAILLFIGTDMLNKQVVKLLNTMSEGFGTYGMRTIPPHRSREFFKGINLSNLWSRIGLFLLIVGFILQFIGNLK